MSLTALQQQFEQVLEREGESVTLLAGTLEQEHEVLVQRDADALQKIVKTKEQQLGQLAGLAKEREALLDQGGYSNDREGFLAFIDSDASGELQARWQAVEQALQKCQFQNQVNGRLLDLSKQQAEETLSLLLGREAGGSKLYDQSGNTSNSYGQNTSIKV